MTQSNVDELTWSIAGEDTLRPELQRLTAADLERVTADPTNPLGETYEMSEEDREIMARPAYAGRMQRLTEKAYHPGRNGSWVSPRFQLQPWSGSAPTTGSSHQLTGNGSLDKHPASWS